jgi:hypothetical protein
VLESDGNGVKAKTFLNLHHYFDTIIVTPWKHFSTIRHHANTMPTLFKHHPNTIPTLFQILRW